MAENVTLATPLETLVQVSLPLGAQFKEFPAADKIDNLEPGALSPDVKDRIAYNGFNADFRFCPVSLQSEHILIVSPFIKLGGGLFTPRMSVNLNAADPSTAPDFQYVAQKDLKLTHFDFGAGLMTGGRLSPSSHLVISASLLGSKYKAAETNPDAEPDRYGKFDNPNDQGGIPLPLQHENAQPTDKFNLTGEVGVEIKIGLTKQETGPSIHVGGNFEGRVIATENKGTLHLNGTEISAAFSYTFL